MPFYCLFIRINIILRWGKIKFLFEQPQNVIYVVLACSKNYDRHLWFWLQWKAGGKKSVQRGWGTFKNKDRGGSGGVNILFAFPHPFPPWATLTPNQTWPFEEMITSVSMLTPPNKMPALQAKYYTSKLFSLQKDYCEIVLMVSPCITL